MTIKAIFLEHKPQVVCITETHLEQKIVIKGPAGVVLIIFDGGGIGRTPCGAAFMDVPEMPELPRSSDS